MFDASEPAVPWACLCGCYYECDYEHDQAYYWGKQNTLEISQENNTHFFSFAQRLLTRHYLNH